VYVPVQTGTRAKDVTVEISPTRLKVGLKGHTPIIDGELFKNVLKENSFWQLEDKQHIVIYLAKQNGMEWWSSVIKGEPLIDISKIDPDAINYSNLNEEKKATIAEVLAKDAPKIL
jgi:hypothetical protein